MPAAQQFVLAESNAHSPRPRCHDSAAVPRQRLLVGALHATRVGARVGTLVAEVANADEERAPVATWLGLGCSGEGEGEGEGSGEGSGEGEG